MEWIYRNSSDNKSRFVLGIKGEKTLICFGVNPSTAEPNKLDRTMESVDRIAKNNGFDSWIMLNVYSQRATNPNDLDSYIDKALHKRNLEEIERIMSKGTCTAWAAWGTLIKKRKYLIECLKDIDNIVEKYDCKWITIGKASKEGHPHHPLYLKSSESIKEFLLENYLQLF